VRLNRRGFLGRAGALALALCARPLGSRADDCGADCDGKRVSFVRLPDGRRLAFNEYGDPRGSCTILYHHGLTSCRLEAENFLDALRGQPSVRLLAVDRPGIGLSDPHPSISFLGWPGDVAAFTAALGVERFALLATSGGTPYALATAHALPDQVTRVVLASPVAPLESLDGAVPYSRRHWLFARRDPLLAAAVLRTTAAALRRNPDGPIPGTSAFAPADQALLADPEVHRFATRLIVEAVRRGPAGTIHEAALLTCSWACWLKEVPTRVQIFHGCADRTAPPAMGRFLAAALPNAEEHTYVGEGHLTVPRKYAAEILAAALAPG
jgi:pimeloyl-ACP methyl ester carboxylesterase